jgi:hypothetical protein
MKVQKRDVVIGVSTMFLGLVIGLLLRKKGKECPEPACNTIELSNLSNNDMAGLTQFKDGSLYNLNAVLKSNPTDIKFRVMRSCAPGYM